MASCSWTIRNKLPHKTQPKVCLLYVTGILQQASGRINPDAIAKGNNADTRKQGCTGVLRMHRGRFACQEPTVRIVTHPDTLQLTHTQTGSEVFHLSTVKGQSSFKRLAGEQIQHLPGARMCCRQEIFLQPLFKQKDTTMTRLRVIKAHTHARTAVLTSLLEPYLFL